MVRIKISKTLEKKIRFGYPWVFCYQVQSEKTGEEPNELGVIYDSKNQFLAMGLYDSNSDIRLRILQTLKPVNIDGSFFEERLNKAMILRSSLLAEGTTGYRVINGENDGFPGLVLDLYGKTIVMKLYTIAWTSYLDVLVMLFKKKLSVERCVLRWSRKVAESKKVSKKYSEGCLLFGEKVKGPVCFKENGINFEADVISGQKTGFFLDQRNNRQTIRSISKGKSVLNVFSYTGAFSVYAFAGGAVSVLEVDSNSRALMASRKNLRLHFQNRNFSTQEFSQIKADGFEALSELDLNNQKYDLVVLDPPAFAKRKNQKSTALNAYMKLARAGAKVTKKGGILFAASCSVHVTKSSFFESVFLGIRSAGCRFEEISRTGHAKDHPFIFREGEYLKGVFCEVV